MQWPPSDPKLAREASNLLAELNLSAQLDGDAAKRVHWRYIDMLARLIYLRLGVVPCDYVVFGRQVNEFIDELGFETAASGTLVFIFRAIDEKAEVERQKFALILELYWRARWYSLGCPAVTIEGKLAASLMATETAAECIAAVKPPWDCFIVRLPMDLIENTQLKYSHVVVHRYVLDLRGTEEAALMAKHYNIEYERAAKYLEKKSGFIWGIYAMGADGDPPLSRNNRLAVLLGNERPEYLIHEPAEHTETSDDRLTKSLARLVVGMCHLAETPNTLRRKSTKKQAHRWRFSKMPVTMEYVLAPDVPVRFDCTEAMGAYLRGERKGPPRIQYVVRGHWRNQAHGPGRMARKRIWIQPHWKGPEDAPRLFREHRLEGEDDHEA